MANRLFHIGIFFVIFSFLATILHEYGHFVILKILGGDGILLFGFGPLIFPWDESHVVLTSLPPGTSTFLLFTSGGSLFALFVLGILYFALKDRNAKVGLEFAIAPQIAWTLAEPASFIARSAPGTLSQINSILPSFYSYHVVLIGSWAIAAIHLSGLLGRVLANLRKRPK
ncbi:MAG: hypothetical protein ACE5KG_01350 [Nitrososphaerales archaeon]